MSENKKVWRVTGYMPTHKQFSLPDDIEPEEITRLTKAQPKLDPNHKQSYQWEFFASRYFRQDNGDWTEIALPCSIWDYYGSRWSAYGPPEVFRELGLLPEQAQP